MATIEQEIIRLEEEMAAAFNKRDLDEVLSAFDAGMVGFSSTTHDRIQSLEQLRKTFEYYLSEGETVEYEISDMLVKDFGTVAIASFHWLVTIQNGERTQHVPGRGTHVFLKKDGRWRIVHEHFSRAHHS